MLILLMSASSIAGVFVSVTVAPPVLPVYEQPPCPGDGYIWTPGYWAYGPDGYYWVPGTWVVPPTVGLLWTPGYWGWSEGVYLWHAGYWGPHIGFYGGVNYGFGYFGTGYQGGYWSGRTFFYNRTVNNVTITNVHIYNKTVVNNVTVNRVSYNGGPAGINARAGREEERAAHERHFAGTRMQVQHEHAARSNRAFLESENHGRPAIAATARPGEFHGKGGDAVRGREVSYGRANDHVGPRSSSVREAERPMPRQQTHENRVPRPEHNFRQGGDAPHPSAYHPEGARSRESAPHNEREAHANGHHEEKRH